MKTLSKVEISPVFLESFIPPDEELLENTLYISKEYKSAIHKCLCGCGNKSVTPFNDPVTGWMLTESDRGVSLTPSILNNNCPNRSHYVITNNVANIL